MTEKKRNMTERGFLHKASGKVSAIAFIAQHRLWLESGDLASFTLPILRKLDSKDLLPTPALEEISAVVLGHMLAKETARTVSESKPKVSKPWQATVYNAKGDIVTRINSEGNEELLQKGFDSCSDADRWCDRRLFEGASDTFGVVNHTSITTKNGELLATTIMRGDAIARILKAPKSPVMKAQSKSKGGLGFGVKAHEDRSTFSRG